LRDTAWKLLAEWEIHPFGCDLAAPVGRPTCRSVGIRSKGLDELRLLALGAKAGSPT
jgi:hypothetical protein